MILLIRIIVKLNFLCIRLKYCYWFMDKLPYEIWKNHLTINLSDAEFVHLVCTCRIFYRRYSRCKRISTRYPVSQIYHIVDRYDFSEIVYDLKIFYPEYLPRNLDTIQFWGLPKIRNQVGGQTRDQIGNQICLKSYPRMIICKSLDSYLMKKKHADQIERKEYLDIRTLISPKLESLQVDLWFEEWMGTLMGLTRLTDLCIDNYYAYPLDYLIDPLGWLKKIKSDGFLDKSDLSSELKQLVNSYKGQKNLNYHLNSLKYLTHLSILSMIGDYKKVALDSFPPRLEKFRLERYPRISQNLILENLPRSVTSLTVPFLNVRLTQLRVLRIVDIGFLDINEKKIHRLIHQIIENISDFPLLEELKIFSGVYGPKKITISSEKLRKLSITSVLKDVLIRIRAPMLKMLSLKDIFTEENMIKWSKFRLETPLLSGLSIRINMDKEFVQNLEDRLIPELVHLDTLKLESENLTFDVRKLGTQMQNVRLSGLNYKPETSFAHIVGLRDLRLEYLCIKKEYYQISELPRSLTRLELCKIANRKLHMPGQLRHLVIRNAPHLTKLVLPENLTYLNIDRCPRLQKMNIPRSILKIYFRESHEGTLQKINDYIQNSPKNIILIY
jgi:hypothetical protein